MKKGVEYKFVNEKFEHLTILKYSDLYRVFSKTRYKSYYTEPGTLGDDFYHELPQKWKDRMGQYYGYNYNLYELDRAYGSTKPHNEQLIIPTSILSV